MDNKNYKPTLSDIVKKEIGQRIIICLFFVMIAFLLSMIYDIYSQINLIADGISGGAKNIEGFIISQKLVSNPDAIKVYIAEYNKEHPKTKLNVFNNNIKLKEPVMRYVFPYQWEYIYPLKLNQNFGYFTISGSYLSDGKIVHNMLIRGEISIAFLCSILIILLPLSKRIPKKIFIEPVDRLIKTIHNEYDKNDISKFPNESIEIQSLRNEINALIYRVEESSKERALIGIATQVAHDIRSPLAAINTAVTGMSNLEENIRLMIINASRRLNDIANNLLNFSKKSKSNLNEDIYEKEEKAFPELLFVVIDNIISEKKLEYKATNNVFKFGVEENSYCCFSDINLAILKRILSNLINNSVEAVINGGVVTVYLKCDEKYSEITISDNGKGIPKEVLEKIGTKGFSYGKENGAGLGLAYTKEYIEKLKGILNIESELNFGTRVTIKLLRSYPPKWFCENICIKEGQNVFVLDDDTSIHDVWREKLIKHTKLKIIDMYNVSEIRDAICNNVYPDICFIDYELLGSNSSGLNIIEDLAINSKSILVTSWFEEVSIREKCEKLGVKIIPKSLVPYIPVISIKNDGNREPSIVFIDDDKMIRFAWEFAAENSQVKLYAFSSPSEFESVIDNFCFDTPIYVDSKLGDGADGADFSKKLHGLGFKKIYLATGYSPKEFNFMPWISGIVGKTPPFLN